MCSSLFHLLDRMQLSYDLNEPGPTITCIGYWNVDGTLHQLQTVWSVTQVGKSPTSISVSNSIFTLSNDTIASILNATTTLTILNVTSNLDGATITCSNPNLPANTASFVLRTYRKFFFLGRSNPMRNRWIRNA